MHSGRQDDVAAVEPLWHLLYRYWFWGWLFLDVNRGDLLRRAAALRHNVQQRVHLPLYMRRWTVCLTSQLAAGYALELASSPPALTASFFVAASVGLVIVAVAAAAWAALSFR